MLAIILIIVKWCQQLEVSADVLKPLLLLLLLAAGLLPTIINGIRGIQSCFGSSSKIIGSGHIVC